MNRGFELFWKRNFQALPLAVPFIPTISYSAPPSRPLPLPLPRLNPSSSCPTSASLFAWVVVFEVNLAAAAPKSIGCSSLHWHAQIPRAYKRASLDAWSAHQRRLVGKEREYREVTMRCRKCIVREKSRTNFERETRSRRYIVLS